MRCLVLGAGVIGVTTAHALLDAGHDVTIVDAAASVGDGATAGNAGILTTGDSTVWASPSAVGDILAALAGRRTSMRVEGRGTLRFARWAMRFGREIPAPRNRANVAANYHLAELSRTALLDIAEREALDFGLRRSGLLLLFANRDELDAGRRARSTLEALGQRYDVLDTDQLIAVDPTFATSPSPPVGALHAPTDMSGDAQQFTEQLADRCRARGVEVWLETAVGRFRRDRSGVVGIESSRGLLHADRYIVCLGHDAGALAASAGDRLAMMPATGFSLTAPIVDPAQAPVIPGVDESRHVAYSTTPTHMRISSSAVIGRAERSWTDDDFAAIDSTIVALFPGAADWDAGVRRARARPVVARNRPVIGVGRDPHIFYNSGHGHLGWTLACGAAQLLVHAIAGTTAPIDAAPYRL